MYEYQKHKYDADATQEALNRRLTRELPDLMFHCLSDVWLDHQDTFHKTQGRLLHINMNAIISSLSPDKTQCEAHTEIAIEGPRCQSAHGTFAHNYNCYRC